MTTREYETVFVLNPAVDDAQVDAEVERIREFLSGKNGQVTEIQKWGRRKLAYEVGKNKEGIYTLIRFSSDSSVPAELERRYRLNENMLRFLTVAYEKPSPAEIARAESAAARAAAGDDDADGDDER